MAKILLIETATEVCGAAISVDGTIVAMREEQDSKSHASLLTKQIEACCREAEIALSELDAVAVSQGPGSYTTLRVGVSTAKAICYALDKPLIAVDTLQALAAASRDDLETNNSNILEEKNWFAPMIDARRMEVCMAIFDALGDRVSGTYSKIIKNDLFVFLPTESTQALLVDTSEEGDSKGCVPVKILSKRLILSGNGAEKARDVINSAHFFYSNVKMCSVRHMPKISESKFQNSDFQNIAYLSPVYMKPPNITSARNTQF